jgi:hypothetical protein
MILLHDDFLIGVVISPRVSVLTIEYCFMCFNAFFLFLSLQRVQHFNKSTKFHEILFSSFRGVALTNCVTDRTGQDRTDGQDKNNMSPDQSGGRHNETRKSLKNHCSC